MELMDGNTKETLLMPKESQSQPVTHSSMPKESARRTVLLRSTTSQVPMRPTTELPDIASLTKESQSQLAILMNMLKVNAKKTA